jgi:hypothetical protein
LRSLRSARCCVLRSFRVNCSLCDNCSLSRRCMAPLLCLTWLRLRLHVLRLSRYGGYVYGVNCVDPVAGGCDGINRCGLPITASLHCRLSSRLYDLPRSYLRGCCAKLRSCVFTVFAVACGLPARWLQSRAARLRRLHMAVMRWPARLRNAASSRSAIFSRLHGQRLRLLRSTGAAVFASLRSMFSRLRGCGLPWLRG